MISVSPVFSDKEKELEFIDNQATEPLHVLPITLHLTNKEDGSTQLVDGWGAATRWRFNDEDRAAIAAGADLVITELVFGKNWTPLNFQIVKPEERPQF